MMIQQLFLYFLHSVQHDKRNSWFLLKTFYPTVAWQLYHLKCSSALVAVSCTILWNQASIYSAACQNLSLEMAQVLRQSKNCSVSCEDVKVVMKEHMYKWVCFFDCPCTLTFSQTSLCVFYFHLPGWQVLSVHFSAPSVDQDSFSVFYTPPSC